MEHCNNDEKKENIYKHEAIQKVFIICTQCTIINLITIIISFVGGKKFC